MLLLKFAGRPDADVARLIDEIAEGVEGVAEALFTVDGYPPGRAEPA